MRLKTPFHVLPAYFDDVFCDHVIEMGEAAEQTQAAVGRDPTGDLRDSTVSWLGIRDEFSRIHEAVTTLVTETNDAHWNWDVTEPEGMQYAFYGPGQHYDWHTDSRALPYKEGGRWAGTIRKISVSVHLSDPADYDGGALLIEDPTARPDRRRATPASGTQISVPAPSSRCQNGGSGGRSLETPATPATPAPLEPVDHRTLSRMLSSTESSRRPILFVSAAQAPGSRGARRAPRTPTRQADPEAFPRFWLEEHGPFGRGLADALGIRRYIRIHVRHPPGGEQLRAPEPPCSRMSSDSSTTPDRPSCRPTSTRSSPPPG